MADIPDVRLDDRDDDALLAMVADCPDAFGALYRRYERPILAYLIRRVPSADVAADLHLEVFAAALSGLRDEKGPRPPSWPGYSGSPVTRSPTAIGTAASRPQRVTYSRCSQSPSTTRITGAHVFEQATACHRQSTWTSGQPNVIQTTTLSGIHGSPRDPAAMLRAMYRAGHVTVVGPGELNGRPVWHLEVAAPTIQRVGSRAPGVTIVIDAKTVDPIELTGYAVQSTRNGPFKVVSADVTRYLVIQHLPTTTDNRALLRITDHPHARIVHSPSRRGRLGGHRR